MTHEAFYVPNICLRARIHTPRQMCHQKLLPAPSCRARSCVFVSVFVCVFERNAINAFERNGRKKIGIDLNALAECQRPQFNEDTNFLAVPLRCREGADVFIRTMWFPLSDNSV